MEDGGDSLLELDSLEVGGGHCLAVRGSLISLGMWKPRSQQPLCLANLKVASSFGLADYYCMAVMALCVLPQLLVLYSHLFAASAKKRGTPPPKLRKS